MDLTQLRAFVAVAKEANLTRAAEQLHVTQPAVSLQIKSLQESLQLTLFTRSASGMRLTNDGARLLPFAEKVIASIDFNKEVRNHRGMPDEKQQQEILFYLQLNQYQQGI